MNSVTSSQHVTFWQKLDYGLLLALVLPLFAVLPLLTHTGLPNTADGPAHLMRQVELNQAWQQGHFYPRWGTDLALGHGMPIFSYAPPILYQLTQLFHLTGLPLDESMKGVLVLDFLLYSVGMFLFARRIYGPAPALVAAAVYVYAPYRLREAYIQGNYGQFTGLAFYPLILWGFHGLITDGRLRYWVAASAALAGLLFSHNISFMVFVPLLGVYPVFLLGRKRVSESASQRVSESVSLRRKWRPPSNPLRWGEGQVTSSRPFLRTLAAGLLGLGLAAVFWLPAFGERHDIKLEGITQTFFDFRENFISLPELLSPPYRLDLTAINPYFPLSLGLPQLIGAGLAVVGVVFVVVSRVKKSTNQRVSGSASPAHAPQATHHILCFSHTLFFLAAFFVYAFLTLPVSQFLWESVPLLELAEFPWRMLGPAIFCAGVLAGAAFWMMSYAVRASKYASRITPILLLISIFTIIALNAPYLYPSQFISWGTPAPADAFAYEVQSGAIGTTSTGEFLPRWAQQHPDPDTLWPDYRAGRAPQKIDPASLPTGATVETLSHQAESDSWRINTPDAFEATIRTLYWPGWQLYLDGRPIDFTITHPTGLIQTNIPPGQHTLTLQLESTPLRSLGQWLSLGAALILIFLVALAIKGRRRSAVSRQSSSTTISPQFFIVATAGLILFYLLSRPLAPLFVPQSDPNRPQPADRIVQADFGDQLRLVGVDQLPDTVQPGETLAVTVYWRAMQDLATNYSVFLHLDAPNGQTMATVDEVDPEYIPTRNWPPSMYLRNVLKLDIPDLAPIRYDVTVGAYSRETGERLALPDGSTAYKIGSVWLDAPAPPPATSLARFGPHITLRHAEFDGQHLTLYWKTNAPLEQNLSIFVHLLDAQGNLLAQSDGMPYDGLYPLPHWRPEQVVVDVRAIATLLENPAQLQTIAIGIYDPITGERLPVTDNAEQPLPNDSVLLPVMR